MTGSKGNLKLNFFTAQGEVYPGGTYEERIQS